MSIVIVVWNALAYATACLESVFSVDTARTFEVIVIDNGSEPEVLAWLEQLAETHPDLRYVRLPANVGFARGSNIGIRLSRGRHVVLLNSDTLVTDAWLDRLIGALDGDATLGLVSPVTNYVGEGDQIDDDARDIHPDRVAEYARSISERSEVILVPERVAFFCVAASRQLFDRLNGLDEGFGLGNFEDEDFCCRLQMLGYGVGVVRNAFVFHHGSKTFEANRVDHSEWMLRNFDRYIGKVERACTQFPPARRRGGGDPLISVVVRTRNRPNDLQIALNSLMWQTFRRFEVVVVNDGGVGIDEVLAPYRSELTLLEVVNQPGHGPAMAANDGVDVARGRYVTFLDDDDIVYPFHLASLAHEAERVDAGRAFVYSHYNRALVRGRGDAASVVERVHLPTWKYDRRDLLVQNRPPLHTWLLPRDLFVSQGGFDTSLAILKDWDFLLRVTERTPLVGVPRETCEYRIYLDLANSVTSGRRQALEELQEIYRRHRGGSPVIEVGRQLELAGVESQIAKGTELAAKVERGEITQEDAARQYIASAFGLGVR